MSILKKQGARRAAARRHQQLLDAARHILSRHAIENTVTAIDPAEIVAVAFGRYAIRVTEGEATDYLNAVLADRGYPLHQAAVAPAVGDGTQCPAAFPTDTSQCEGPPAVIVLDSANRGVEGCEHHAAQLLASLEGGRVYALPGASAGAAIRVFKASGAVRADGAQ